MRVQWIQVPSNMHQLPSFYWLPKLHRNPYGNSTSGEPRLVARANYVPDVWKHEQ